MYKELVVLRIFANFEVLGIGLSLLREEVESERCLLRRRDILKKNKIIKGRVKVKEENIEIDIKGRRE